jgi:hypothetical protein
MRVTNLRLKSRSNGAKIETRYLVSDVGLMLFASLPRNMIGDSRLFEERTDQLEDIFIDLRRAFPDIEFELDAASQTVNAQAIDHGDIRIVRLYGGLAFHSLIDQDGLVLTLLHEVGHHLAAGGRLTANSRLACECMADRWAMTKGAPRLEKKTGRSLDIDRAAATLDRLAAAPRQGATVSNAAGPRNCWGWNWSRRKQLLAKSRGSLPLVRNCPMPDYYTLENSHH